MVNGNCGVPLVVKEVGRSFISVGGFALEPSNPGVVMDSIPCDDRMVLGGGPGGGWTSPSVEVLCSRWTGGRCPLDWLVGGRVEGDDVLGPKREEVRSLEGGIVL